MQSWVYLTLPEVKHAPETEKEFPRNLLILPPPGGKRYTFLFRCTPSHPMHHRILQMTGSILNTVHFLQKTVLNLTPGTTVYELGLPTLPRGPGIYVKLDFIL